MERKKWYEEENDATDTWCIVIDYLLSVAVEKSCSFPMGTQVIFIDALLKNQGMEFESWNLKMTRRC